MEWSALVAAKAVPMHGTPQAALRTGERRTLARWTIIDFATAVALGAIIRRTRVASHRSHLTGAVAALVAVHRPVSILRHVGYEPYEAKGPLTVVPAWAARAAPLVPAAW